MWLCNLITWWQKGPWSTEEFMLEVRSYCFLWGCTVRDQQQHAYIFENFITINQINQILNTDHSADPHFWHHLLLDFQTDTDTAFKPPPAPTQIFKQTITSYKNQCFQLLTGISWIIHKSFQQSTVVMYVSKLKKRRRKRYHSLSDGLHTIESSKHKEIWVTSFSPEQQLNICHH